MQEAATLLLTLFELGREVTSVLDLHELLEKIPELIARLTPFQAFAVYLLDERRGDLRVAYSVGYPEEARRTLRMKVGEGLVGAAVSTGESILVDDVLERATCERVRQAMDSGTPEAAEILEDDIARNEQVRRTSHIEVDEQTLALFL